MTSTETAVGRFERLQPRNWSLPVKLAAVLLVPTLLGVGLGVARVVEHTNQANALAAVDRFVVLEGKASAVIGQLQQERDQASVFVQNNRTGDKAALQTLFGTTDDAVNDLATAVGEPATMGGAAQTAFQQAQDNLSRVTQLRDQVTGNGVQGPDVIAQYTGLIEPLTVFEAALDRQLNTPALAGPAAGLTALTTAQEQIALQHAVIAVAIARGEMLPPDADTVRTADAQLGAAVDQFRAALDADQQSRNAGFTTDAANNQRQQLKQAALSRIGARGQLGISPADWDNAYNSVLEQLRTAGDGLRGDIQRTSAAQQDAARNAAGIDSVILLLALLAAAAVVYLVGRSMLKPLRLLRTTALDIAERRLPKAVQGMRAGEMPNVVIDPVPVHSIEEIGQVARAFDHVHGQAIRLAAEQATLQTNVSSMFVNLSRRSQGLVERQLQLIEQLERNEQDSEQLANLFQLDHLATRMRRNSENLLVLAGSDLAKRGSRPVPLVDVLRAAVSEIEQYQRVVVQQPPTEEIVGRAASDMVHLVAELLDNATAFSAPDTQVVVSSSVAADGTLSVQIVDQGVGMPGEELVAANNRLAGPNEVDVSASRRMGLFVVGRLAARHGVGVQLANSDQYGAVGGGVTASVSIPLPLIASSGALADRIGTTNAVAGSDSAAVTRTGAGIPTGMVDRLAATSTGLIGAGANGAAAGRNGTGRNGAGRNGAGVNGTRGGGTGVNGTGVNGTGVNGTTGANGTGANGTGANRAGVSETGAGFGAAAAAGTGGTPAAAGPRGGGQGDSAALPRRSAPAEPGALPRRAVGAALSGSSALAASEVTEVRKETEAASAGEPGKVREPRQSPEVATPAANVRDAAQLAPDEAPAVAEGPDGGRGQQSAVESSRPLAARQDTARGGRPQPPNGRPPAGQGRRYPQQPYLRGARGPGQSPPGQGRFAQQGPGAPPSSSSGQFPMAPAGQRPAAAPGPAAPGPAASRPPTSATGSQSMPVPPVPQTPAPPAQQPGQPVSEPAGGRSGSAPANGRADAAPVNGRADAAPANGRADAAPVNGRADAAPANGRAEAAPANGRSGSAPATDRAETGTGRKRPGGSPIFEEMASAWFRENWANQGQGAGSAEPARKRSRSDERAGGHSRGKADAESGWDAGELLSPMPEPVDSGEVTIAGLPKRRPRSQLIPGGPSEQGSEPANVPARSAEQVRGRLSSYQQGVRQGRESRHRRVEVNGGGRHQHENVGEENS